MTTNYLRPIEAQPTEVYAAARRYLGTGYTNETQHAFAMWVLDNRYDRETGYCPSLAQCWLDWSDDRLGIVR